MAEEKEQMTTELLAEAQRKKSEREQKRELLLPLRQKSEELISLHGEVITKHFPGITGIKGLTTISSFMKEKFNLNFPIRDEDTLKTYQNWVKPNTLKTELQIGGSVVKAIVWRQVWFDVADNIYVELEALPKRLVLRKRLEESRIEELKTKNDFSYSPIKYSDFTSRFPTEKEVEQFSQILSLLEQKLS